MTASACRTPCTRLASDQSKDEPPPDFARRLTGNTSWPDAARRFERCEPMNPDAPVMRTLMGSPRYWVLARRFGDFVAKDRSMAASLVGAEATDRDGRGARERSQEADGVAGRRTRELSAVRLKE